MSLSVIAGVGALAGAWASAWLARGERPGRGDVTAFASGLFGVLVALTGPLHDLSDHSLFSAHMVQHIILTSCVPPLLVAGTPGWMVDTLLRRLRVTRIARQATRPVAALGVYTATLVAWHLPGPFAVALDFHAWHIVEHLMLMAAATLAWWPVVSRSRSAPGIHYSAQILYLFALGIPMTIVAAMITNAETVLYPFYAAAPRVADLTPLADQRLGGVIMWVPAGLVPLIAFTIQFFRWSAAEPDLDELPSQHS
jgi:putative membrane protein